MEPSTVRKVQACRKCGKVFAIKETTGPGLGMPNIHELGSKVCPSCGGDVVWREVGQGTGPGCAGMVLLIVVLAAIGSFLLP